MYQKYFGIVDIIIFIVYRSSGRAREAWSSRSRERHDPYNREYDVRRRDRYSPSTRRDMSPPHAKRMRHDW